MPHGGGNIAGIEMVVLRVRAELAKRGDSITLHEEKSVCFVGLLSRSNSCEKDYIVVDGTLPSTVHMVDKTPEVS